VEVRPGVDPLRQRKLLYRGISRGVFFICIGAVLLLNTSGWLGWGVWGELLRFWPVLLISLGIRLIFSGTPLHVLSLMGPALVIATTGWVAATWNERSESDWSRFDASGTKAIECPPEAGSGPATLDIEFGAGRLDLAGESLPPAAASAPRAGFRGSLRHAGDDPHVECRGGDVTLRRRSTSGRIRLFVPFDDDGARWEARLASDGPVRLRMDLAASRANLDLRRIRLAGAEIDAAAADLSLRLGVPQGRVSVRLDGAASDVHILAPAGVCVEVSGEWVLNLIEIEGERGWRRRALPAESSACAKSGPDGPRYEIHYHLPVSSLSVDTEPASS